MAVEKQISKKSSLGKFNENSSAIIVECPGCKIKHVVTIKRKGSQPCWDFNGNLESPSFNPSLMVRFNWGDETKEHVCHSYIRDGQWIFLKDSTHDLAGQTVDMLPV